MSSSIFIQLLICIVVLLPSCYRGETELNKEDSSNQFLNLKTEDLENAIQYGTQQINMLSRHEDSLSYADYMMLISMTINLTSAWLELCETQLNMISTYMFTAWYLHIVIYNNIISYTHNNFIDLAYAYFDVLNSTIAVNTHHCSEFLWTLDRLDF
ncbi:hypothetical protein QTP88_024543 [Uroleucon formosanum]